MTAGSSPPKIFRLRGTGGFADDVGCFQPYNKKAAAARAARKKRYRADSTEGGRHYCTVRKVRGRIAKRAEDEVEKARNALRRAEITAEKKGKSEG